jgi:hypothetical protein
LLLTQRYARRRTTKKINRGAIMLRTGRILVAVTLAALGVAPAAAQTSQPRPCPVAIEPDISCFTAQDSNGAYVLAARPANWNGSLIVHAYGGPRMRKPDAAMNDEDLERSIETVREGYAWVSTSRRRGGFGVPQGAEDAENARKLYMYFRPAKIHDRAWTVMGREYRRNPD